MSNQTPAKVDAVNPHGPSRLKFISDFIGWVFTCFGLLKKKENEEEIVVYSIGKGFLTWPLILIGHIGTLWMAQRLARKLCANCKEEIIPQGEQKKSIDDILTSIQDKSLIPSSYEKIYRAKGCNKCNNTGYSGRIGIYEAILSSKEVEDAVEKNPSEREIWQAAKNQELLTLKQDGVLKVLQGVTSMEELERVIALSD
jgi:hypothetical protein